MNRFKKHRKSQAYNFSTSCIVDGANATELQILCLLFISVELKCSRRLLLLLLLLNRTVFHVVRVCMHEFAFKRHTHIFNFCFCFARNLKRFIFSLNKKKPCNTKWKCCVSERAPHNINIRTVFPHCVQNKIKPCWIGIAFTNTMKRDTCDLHCDAWLLVEVYKSYGNDSIINHVNSIAWICHSSELSC